MIRSHVVVDGSNIATEGRTTPSLRQLDDAVTAFLAEHEVETLTVVVDATFPNRIDASERAEYEAALLAGELVTPPAGAIGRGDAFILQIAEKVGATVLSNDSFQELHAKHPWVFEEGRLIGGKPVPGVGWVFLLRTPVRGPVSRRATAQAKAKDRSRPTPSSPKPASEADSGGRRRRGGRRRSGDAAATETRPASAPPAEKRDRTPRKPAEPANDPLPFIEFVAKHPVGSTLEGEVESFSSHGAYVLAGGARCYVPLKLMGDPAPRAARDVMVVGETRRFAVHSLDTPRRGIDLALVADATVRRTSTEDTTTVDAAKTQRSQGPSTDTTSVGRLTAAGSGRASTRKTSTNDAVVGTTSPPDEHAEEATVTPAKKAGAKKAPAKKAPAKKTAAKKTAAKKAPAKKAAAKKTVAKKAPAKKAPAKKTAAKKAPARKTAAKKAPARKTAAKKAPAKKTAAKKAPAKKAPARKTAAKKAPARKTAAKKAPAKRATGRR